MMVKTAYSEELRSVSDRAHLVARESVYPHIFKNALIEYEVAPKGAMEDGGLWQVLDGQLAIDVMLKVRRSKHTKPILFTVQERFRDIKWMDYQQLSFTYNTENGETPEVSKLAAHFFVCGYFDPTIETIADAICVSVPRMMFFLMRGDIPYVTETNDRTGQGIVFINFDDLQAARSAVWRMRMSG